MWRLFGGGTIAFDHIEGRILPHMHVAVGLKDHSAAGRTSHLLSAKIQFLAGMVLVEVVAPVMTRRRDPRLYDVPLLQFGGSDMSESPRRP